MRFDVGGPAHPSRSVYGPDEALRLVPVYAAVKLIAEYVASLPLKLYTKEPSGHLRRYDGPSMFDDPAPDTNMMDWLYECLTSLLLQGNAWGYILSRDGYGYPQQIAWQPPDMVTVEDDQKQPYNPLRTKVYFYGRQMSREEYIHIKAFSLPGRTEAVSPMRAFAMTIANGLESVRYGTDWFAAGGFPPGTFKNNEIEIDPAQSAEIRGLLNQSIRRREPLVYGRDWDYHPVTVPPSEAQFIENTQMNATQIAAVYGLPPERIGGRRGDSLTYSTVQQSALQIIEALRPWMVRLERAFTPLLPGQRECRFNADALLRTDLRERADIYRVWRDIGFKSLDEMRDTEDLEPLPNGMGKDTIPLDAIVAMSRSTRAIPNSIVPQVTLEAKIIADYLQDLMAGQQPAATAAGNAPNPDVVSNTPAPAGTPNDTQQPPKQQGQNPLFNPLDPAAYLTKVVSSVRSGDADEDLLAALIRKYMRKPEGNEPDPEFVGPWIPPDKAAQHSRNGSNGRGH